MKTYFIAKFGGVIYLTLDQMNTSPRACRENSHIVIAIDVNKLSAELVFVYTQPNQRRKNIAITLIKSALHYLNAIHNIECATVICSNLEFWQHLNTRHVDTLNIQGIIKQDMPVFVSLKR